ncbi:MAG: GNAT family N-acetyltransferase [Bacillota bacterium]
MLDVEVRPAVSPEDWAWCGDLWRREWGGEVMVTRGRLHRFQDLQALIAWSGEERLGLATYRLEGGEAELMSLNAAVEGRGVGTALLRAAEGAAAESDCRRLWLITTNDNLEALRFYQRRGYRLAALYPGAVDLARQVKPGIPAIGNHGIPLHDELELEKAL